MVAAFTIAFIGSSEYDLMRNTIPHNLRVLTANTQMSFDAILTLDGNVADAEALGFAREAFGWGIDEIRFRQRSRNVAAGDKSNNAHLHLFSDKTPILITMECDVAAFEIKDGTDFLAHIHNVFLEYNDLAVATRIDDFECWIEPMNFLEDSIRADIASVSRLSSHFVIYHTDRVRSALRSRVRPDTFADDGTHFYNYENFLSEMFRKPDGTGIGYLRDVGLRVHHCDTKISPDSHYYTGDTGWKISEFNRLKRLYEAGERR